MPKKTKTSPKKYGPTALIFSAQRDVPELKEWNAEADEMLRNLFETYGGAAVQEAANRAMAKPAHRLKNDLIKYEKAWDADWIDEVAAQFGGSPAAIKWARTAYFYLKNDRSFIEKGIQRRLPTELELDAIRKRHEAGRRISARARASAKQVSSSVKSKAEKNSR